MMSLADLRARVERAYANDRAEVRSGRDVSKWLAAVSYGECVALFEALAAAEAERDEANDLVARYQSSAHPLSFGFAPRPKLERIEAEREGDADVAALVAWIRRLEIVNVDGIDRENAMRDAYSERWILSERARESAEAERDALRAAILADSHHGGEPERCGCGLCAVLAAPVPPAPDERET